MSLFEAARRSATMSDMTTLLGAVAGAPQSPFALLHRPESHGDDRVDLLRGELGNVRHIDDIPLAGRGDRRPPDLTDVGDPRVDDMIVLMPYRQIKERGFDCHDDGEPMVALRVRERAVLTRAAVRRAVPAVAVTLRDGHFEPDDDDYSQLVSRILEDEIGQGSGSNFVIHRSFDAQVSGEPLRCALALFGALLAGETGAYWTFLVYTGERTFVGATPERHISLASGTLAMTPISGTLRHSRGRPSPAEVRRFLTDQKEADELHMVVDEELKVMSRLCAPGVRVTGPRLRSMGRVTHTEYQIEGSCTTGVHDIMRESMFAPTVTGSPVENATRVIAQHESTGRGYYSGTVAVIGRDGAGETELDSAITIRTADIHRSGRLRIGVGATLVRASIPAEEVLETRAKASGLITALQGPPSRPAAASALATPDDPRESEWVAQTLAQRNKGLSRYWMYGCSDDADAVIRAAPHGTRALIVDADDTFTSMLEHMLRSHGVDTCRRDHTRTTTSDLDQADLVVLGPGPGDPRDRRAPKIATLAALVRHLLAGQIPFVAVCLSHQVLCDVIGLPLVQLEPPHQGTQREIEIFGQLHPVGFYNSFVARCDHDRIQPTMTSGLVEVSRDARTSHVHGLRGSSFASVQFHPESVLTRNGFQLVGDLLSWVIAPGRSSRIRADAAGEHDWSRGA